MQEGAEEELQAKDSGFSYEILLYFRRAKKEQPLGSVVVGYLSEELVFTMMYS
ncbi:MAG: hypothetical protein ACLTS6_16840 [Anaerobutyricum sp.]